MSEVCKLFRKIRVPLEKVSLIFSLGHSRFLQNSSGIDLISLPQPLCFRFHVFQAPIIRLELHALIIQGFLYLWIYDRRAACFGLPRLGAL